MATALREVFAKFGFDFDSTNLDKADKATDRMSKKVGGLAQGLQAVAAAFAGSALIGGINRMAAELDVFDDLSAQTKVGVKDLQAFGLAAATNGSSVEEMTRSLTLLQKALGNMSTSEGKLQKDAFRTL